MTSNFSFGQNNTKIVKASIINEMKEEWLKNRKLPVPEKFPIPTNIKEVENKFKADASIFDNYPKGYELSYSYFLTIDLNGKVINIDFLVLANGFIEDLLKKSIMKIKFEPALVNKRPVLSYTIIEYRLTCTGCK